MRPNHSRARNKEPQNPIRRISNRVYNGAFLCLTGVVLQALAAVTTINTNSSCPLEYASGHKKGLVSSIIQLTDLFCPPVYAGEESTLEERLAGLRVNGEQVFEDRDLILEYIQLGGTVEYAKALATIIDKHGHPIFSGWQIISFWQTGGTVEKAKYLASIRDSLEEEMEGHKDSLEDARALAAITNKDGNPVFDDLGIIDFWDAGGTVEEARDLVGIRDSLGNPLFDNGLDIAMYKIVHGTVEYARKLAKIKGMISSKVCRYAQLGISIDEIVGFNDTGKPNALLLLPDEKIKIRYKRLELESAFYSWKSADLPSRIRDEYDVKVAIVGTEQEMYDAISSVPNIELLVISGHGNRALLSFYEGSDARVGNLNKREKYWIDICDIELAKYLGMLNPNAVIFLNSCLNAKGGRNAVNLANFVGRMAPGRRVIASTGSYGAKDITVISLYPFDIEITDEGQNITYSNK